MYLKRKTAEVSSWPLLLSKNASFEAIPDRGSGPQGLRRPRFSFFRFTCQTARKPGGFRPPVRQGADEAEASDRDRMLVPAISEELRRRAIAPVSGRRAVWRGLYGRHPSIVNHQSIRPNHCGAVAIAEREPTPSFLQCGNRSAPRRTWATFLRRSLLCSGVGGIWFRVADSSSGRLPADVRHLHDG